MIKRPRLVHRCSESGLLDFRNSACFRKRDGVCASGYSRGERPPPPPSPMFRGLRSPGQKRKRDSTTPVKRVREKLAKGDPLDDGALPCRALCDAVISCSAATAATDEAEALAELEDLLDGPAKVGVTYNASPDDPKISGTPLFLAATCVLFFFLCHVLCAGSTVRRRRPFSSRPGPPSSPPVPKSILNFRWT